MQLKKFIENSIGLTSNDVHHSSRYLHLDGTPYGTKGLTRFLHSPALPFNLLVATVAGGASIAAAEPVQAACINVAVMAPAMGITYFTQRRHLNKNSLVPNNAVIDTDGESGNPIYSLLMQQKYKSEIATDCVLAVVGAALGGSLGMSGFVASALFFATHSIFYSRAAKNLESNKWKIMLEPPKRREKIVQQSQKDFDKLQPAFG